MKKMCFADRYLIFVLFLQFIFILLKIVDPIAITWIQTFYPIIFGFILWIVGFWIMLAYFLIKDILRDRF